MDTCKAIPMRAKAAIEARKILGNDFFGGWEELDLALFEKYHCPLVGSPDFLTDYFGFKTHSNYIPWVNASGGVVDTNPPIPDDGVRAEAIEYFALFHAFELAKANSFTMIELGASYAPWASAAAVTAIRHGKKVINIRAVEASNWFFEEISNNFKHNNIFNPPDGVHVSAQAIHGAVGIKPGIVYFPIVKSAFENGGQATSENTAVDYVGRDVEHEPVTVRTLDEIFFSLDFIDLVHCDIQGAELDVIVHGAALLSSKVRSIFVGTHSRYIEGVIIECLHKHGWSLVRERPTVFNHRSELQSVVGMTTRDGGQYWVNNRFV